MFLELSKSGMEELCAKFGDFDVLGVGRTLEKSLRKILKSLYLSILESQISSTEKSHILRIFRPSVGSSK